MEENLTASDSGDVGIVIGTGVIPVDQVIENPLADGSVPVGTDLYVTVTADDAERPGRPPAEDETVDVYTLVLDLPTVSGVGNILFDRNGPKAKPKFNGRNRTLRRQKLDTQLTDADRGKHLLIYTVGEVRQGGSTTKVKTKMARVYPIQPRVDVQAQAAIVVGTGVIPVDQVIEPINLVQGEVVVDRDVIVTLDTENPINAAQPPGEGEVVVIEAFVEDPSIPLAEAMRAQGQRRLHAVVPMNGMDRKFWNIKLLGRLKETDKGLRLRLTATGRKPKAGGGFEPAPTKREQTYRIRS